MECWRCGDPYEISENGKIPFRMSCDKCYACLHSCVNCKNYQPGLPNDCKIPDTDPISDREASNFCEEFVLKGQKLALKKGKDPLDISKSLFKDAEDEPPKDNPNPEDRFKSLFGD